MIIKTAAGGTTLSNVKSGLSGTYGNWYPRSLWPEDYDPNIETASTSNNATGILYKLFIENFRAVYSSLVEDGYEPTVLGMCWMQGESDADLGGTYLSNYGTLLRAFINDVRSDVAEITGDDWFIDNMPFVIGKIAPTYYGYNRPVNIQIRTTQDNIARAMSGVDVAETQDLIIIKENGQRNTGCEDDWHFNFADMTTLGERFADKLMDLLN